MKLEARNVVVEFGTRRAVDDVSLDLAPGELVVIVGPNGSGKTTLLRAMLGLIAPSRGTVTLDGKPLPAWSRRAIAETVGALPQYEEPAFPLTVAETLLLGRWARLGPVSAVTPDDRDAIRDALARCDVAGFENRIVDTLSGGERQRVRLARALAGAPKLLLLDEPTAALDIGHEMELFELFRSLAADGLGVLVITHDLNLAARHATRMVLLHNGRVVRSGATSEVLEADVLSQVFAWPIAVEQRNDGPQVVPLRRSGNTQDHHLIEDNK